MRELFKRTVRTAVTVGLVDLAMQAVDGTKLAANTALQRTLDAEKLRKLLDRLESTIRELEAQNEETTTALRRVFLRSWPTRKHYGSG